MANITRRQFIVGLLFLLTANSAVTWLAFSQLRPEPNPYPVQLIPDRYVYFDHGELPMLVPDYESDLINTNSLGFRGPELSEFDECRVLVIGDSAVGAWGGNWPEYASEASSCVWQNGAFGGARVWDNAQRTPIYLERVQPDYVFYHAAWGNIWNRDSLTNEELRALSDFLITIIQDVKLTGAAFYIVAPQATSAAPEAYYQMLTMYEDVADRAGVTYIDVANVVPHSLFTDTGHPNAEGHQILADAICADVQEVCSDN